MSLRDALRDNQATVVTVALLVLIGALAWSAMQLLNNPRNLRPTWYYNLQTGELFIDDASGDGVIETDNGIAYRAVVVGCGTCDDPRIAWLERLPGEGVQVEQDAPPEVTGSLRSPWLVSRKPEPGGEVHWVHSQSRRGKAIEQETLHMCPRDQRPRICDPEP